MKITAKLLLGTLILLGVTASIGVAFATTPKAGVSNQIPPRPRKCFVYNTERKCRAAAPRCIWIGECVSAAK